VVNTVLGEAASLFPDTLLHAGGDEVDLDCWRDDPGVRQWMDAHGLSRYLSVRISLPFPKCFHVGDGVGGVGEGVGVGAPTL
jgi:hypothetical protein